MERYVFIQERRDSQNNIKDCLLRNVATNQIVQVSKDVIKTNLKKKNWIIDGLILAQNTDALCISEKDRLIQDYIEACKTLGLAHVDIVRQNGVYLIKDIPHGKIVKMPSFATYIQINKSLSSPNNQNNQNNGASAGANTARKDTTLDRVDAKVDLVYRFLSTKFNELSGQDTTQSLSTNTHIDAVKSDILGEIQQLKTLLTGMKTGEEQSSADIEAKMQNIANVVDDIFSGQSDIKKEVGDSADELAQSISGLGFSMDTKLSDIKDSIMANGRKIIELKDEVKPILLDLSNKYSSFVQTGGMDKSEARKLDTLPIYARVSKAKYPFGERTVYRTY